MKTTANLAVNRSPSRPTLDATARDASLRTTSVGSRAAPATPAPSPPRAAKAKGPSDTGRPTLDARATLTTVTVVGEPARGEFHALRDELGWLGFHARTAEPSRLRAGASPVVAMGTHALDGGAALRTRLGPRATLIVVLPEDALEARLAAFRVGAHPIVDGDEGIVAGGVVAAIADSPARLGWTTLGAVMDAARGRVGAEVGTGREARAKLRFEDGPAVAEAVERFAQELSRLCVESQAPAATPVHVDQLTWEDEPETRQQDALERAKILELSNKTKRGVRPLHRGPILGGLSKLGPKNKAPGEWSRSTVPPEPLRETVVPDEQQKTAIAAPALGREERISAIRSKTPSTTPGLATFPKPQPSRLPAFEDDETHGGAELTSSSADAVAADAHRLAAKPLPVVLEPALAAPRERVPPPPPREERLDATAIEAPERAALVPRSATAADEPSDEGAQSEAPALAAPKRSPLAAVLIGLLALGAGVGFAILLALFVFAQ